ncbi:MAG TPA: hypothetical protein DET40_09335 [Lentisphaeria bacterium]|nr:MAG: hypothetical protein A2X45_08125 [Lentisphaerae bacterium GWF2_50_93]HCE43740.1 hypothetical protein [Lentisphaeria bacterium]
MISQALDIIQIRKIHEVSMRILSEIGVHVPHDEMLGRFMDSGAKVDFNTKQVFIPEELVRRCLGTAGKKYVLYGRDASITASFGYGGRNYNSSAGEALWIEKPCEDRRYATLPDVAKAVRLADALPHIGIPGAMSDPHELPVEWRCVAVFAEMLRNTAKPVTFWFHDRASAKYLNEIVVAVRGGVKEAIEKPLCYPFLEPISPLSFPFNGIDLLYETSKLNMPVPVGPMAQTGLSAPATLAGTMAQENAEILAGICITQLVKEGMPVCYGGICHAFDMSTTQLIFGGPEQAIFGVAMTQMGRHYGLPVYINVGLTDSKRPDAQAGLESGVTLALGASAGADIFGHMGICGVDQASSLDMLVLQDEIISYVESVNRKMDFSDEAFGFDVMAEAGPKGTFIDKMHTAEHFRNELWFPEMLDRNFYEAWKAKGAGDLESECEVRKEKLLASHEPQPLPRDLEEELARIVGTAKTELGK